MQLMRHSAEGSYEIQAVEPGRVRIEDKDYTSSFIVSPERIVVGWPPASVEELTEEHLSTLLEFEPEVVLLGTGDAIRFPEARVFAKFQSRGVGLEVMDTAAACRTYNVLVSDQRRVVAGLML